MLDGVIPRSFAEKNTLVANPDKKLKVSYLNLEEIKTLISTLEHGRNTKYTARYMILTAIFTGARLAEIAALTWNDINEIQQTITITKWWDYLHEGGFKPTKNESSNRIIAISENLLSLLNELRNNDSNLVFINADHCIPTSNGVNKVIRHAMKKSGISKPGFHFHSLRHSHMAYLPSQGIDLYTISKRLGHSSMTTTAKTYAYLIDEYQQKQNDDIRQKLQIL